jgi:carbonic anhydrase
MPVKNATMRTLAAGNVEPPDAGDTTCDAVIGAIDNKELGNLAGLLAKIKPAVDATTRGGERTSKNIEFVNATARKNAELTIANIRQAARAG